MNYLLALVAALVAITPSVAADRPNILWITSEDNSPYLGCYGDEQAQTPHLDRLAAQGVRYRHAFANAPVCSTTRTTMITGLYATSLGAQHHRSKVLIPARFNLYPQDLRAAGYYCTNNAKTDYNIAGRTYVWDVSSNAAHYKNRAANQPFFAVFNLTTSHESQVTPKPVKLEYRIAPEKIKLPPYHPHTPELRRDWANYYDQMTMMDAQVGQMLDELEQSGQAENTIVVYCSDHGGALPRGKRNIHDTGTRVPLIIRFPKKWAHLAPAKPGEWSEQVVSLVDLPPTFFSLCGVPIPKQYEGRAFLGDKTVAPREHVFLFRGRMDERYDSVRSVRDREYRYVRNYSPHRPWGQHYSYPFQVMPGMKSWHDAFLAGKCNEVQAAYWKTKPSEELYHVTQDPYELKNLVGDAAHAERLTQLRKALRDEILTSRDAGFIPEGMMQRLAGNKTIYEYVHSDAYPLEPIMELADLASEGNEAHLKKLIHALDDQNPIMRYWAATGCLILRDKAAPAKDKLRERLTDEYADVRVVAAEAIGHLQEVDAATKSLQFVLKNGNDYERLAAQNAVDYLREAGQISLANAQALLRGRQGPEPLDRIPQYLLQLAP